MDEVGGEGWVESEVDGGEAGDKVGVVFDGDDAFEGGRVVVIVVTEVTTAADAMGEVSGIEDGGVAGEFGEVVGGVEDDEVGEVVAFEFHDAEFGGDFGLGVHIFILIYMVNMVAENIGLL